MKTLLICIITIITFVIAPTINVKAQIGNDSLSQHMNYKNMATQYLKKSHDQKVTATVLGIGGTVIAGIGLGLALSSLNGLFEPDSQRKDYGSTPDVLMIGGAALIVAAIPISIASRANKKKARLYMNKETVMIILHNSTVANLTCIGIKINL